MVQLKGQVKIVHSDGRIVAEGKNLVVEVGLHYIAARIGSSATAMSHMAVGNSSTGTASEDTALQGTELERSALTSVTVDDNLVTYAGTVGLTFGLTRTIREVGIFDAAAGGTMLCRFICSGFDISPGEYALVEWTITIGT